jgi:hypothetical protein
LRLSRSHRTTERNTQPRSYPSSWARNIVSGILRRSDGSDIELREPLVAEVPYTAIQPKHYHARKKIPAARPPNTHATQQQTSAATQSTPPSSQTPPPAATTSTPSAVAGAARTTGTAPRSDIIVRQAGWWTRLMLWVTSASAEYTSNQP